MCGLGRKVKNLDKTHLTLPFSTFAFFYLVGGEEGGMSDKNGVVGRGKWSYRLGRDARLRKMEMELQAFMESNRQNAPKFPSNTSV